MVRKKTIHMKTDFLKIDLLDTINILQKHKKTSNHTVIDVLSLDSIVATFQKLLPISASLMEKQTSVLTITRAKNKLPKNLPTPIFPSNKKSGGLNHRIILPSLHSQ